MAKKVNKWLDKFPEAQNGIEGTMGGLTDIGFDYNGAWGGTMQMGGSLPGAVGFTYARTQDPAPSNGPYAKKTKASAQNGQEMKFYQEGLDFKPKTISENGGWLEKFQEGGEKTYGTYRLPEVVITGEAPEKGFWEQSIDAYLKENKDAGLLGALGSVVTYPLGLPQQAMMYGLTGKVQKPSEALGVKNSLGAIATDAILDPTNLVGAGIVDDTYKLTSRAGKFLTEETALKDAYKINPFAFKSKNDAYYRMLGDEGLSDAITSRYLRPKQTTTVIHPELGKIEVPGIFDKAYYNAEYPLDKRYYPTIENSKFVTPNQATYKGPYMAEVKGDHNLFKEEEFNPYFTSRNPISIDNSNVKLYKEHWLKGYKEIAKKEDGGIIEDDMGQWAHPGEITKINSNQITMQGVDYPVLGISDTGDTQMMYPGEDYSFDGSSVTEIPMAQKGKKIKFGEQPNPDPFYNPLQYYQYTGKPIKKPWMPGDETIRIKDTRSINAAANAPIRPNKDLVTGKYDANRVSNIASVAKLYNIDPNLLLAIELQETGFGTKGEDPGSESMGHTKNYNITNLSTPSKRGSDEDIMGDEYDFFARAFLEKMKEAKKANLKDSLDIIQTYNGRGIITPKTEKDYHGFEMKEIYGVPLPQKGINMKQNPLYAKRIFDLRDNVIKQNYDLQRLINLAQPINKPVIDYDESNMGEIQLMPEGPIENKKSTKKKENGGWLNKYE